MSVIIRKPTQNDFEEWTSLYHGYAEFYQVPMNDEILNTVWSWIFDNNMPFYALVAEVDGSLVGLMHYRAMPSPLRGENIGFVDDLFIDDKARGSSVAYRLYQSLKKSATENRWSIVRGITAEDNHRARALYDRLGNKTQWVTYQLDI